jgi:hypothetical protein
VVKTLMVLIVTNVVALLELGGVVLLAVVAGMWWGMPAVLVVVAVAMLFKSAELDIRRDKTRRGRGEG